MSAERDIADALTKIAEVLEQLSSMYFGLFTDDARRRARDEVARSLPYPTVTGTFCPGGCGQLPHEGSCFPRPLGERTHGR